MPYWQTWHSWVLVSLLLGEDSSVEQELAARRAESPDTSAGGWWLHSAALHFLLYKDDVKAAVWLGQHLWQSATQRKQLIVLANPYLRGLIASGKVDEARRVAEQALYLTGGLGEAWWDKSLLALGIVLSTDDHSQSCRVIEPTLAHLPFPWNVQAGLYLASNYERLSNFDRAGEVLAPLAPYLQELTPKGLSCLVGCPLPLTLHELSDTYDKGLELHYLGASETRFRRLVQSLRPRFAEFLTILAAYPAGMSAEQLTLAVYGETHNPACCKTELSRLKRLLPIESRPYRLNVPVWADFLEVPVLLEAGKVNEAIDLYQGPLLSASEAPEVCTLRATIDESLRAAALSAPTPEPLWKLVSRMRDDLELWEALHHRLPQGDPRRALTQAHVHSLRRSWGL